MLREITRGDPGGPVRFLESGSVPEPLGRAHSSQPFAQDGKPMRAVRLNVVRWLLVVAPIVTLPPGTQANPDQPPPAEVHHLLNRDLVNAPGMEAQVLTVSYPPGGSSAPHRHDAQVFVYVAEGSVRMQLAGKPAVTLNAGDTFYEGPEDVHLVSANASTTAPAKLLVFMIRDKAKPESRPVQQR